MDFFIVVLCFFNLGLNLINFVILRDLDVGDYEDDNEFLDSNDN